MRYNGIFDLSFLLVVLPVLVSIIIIILKSSLNIIITSKIQNEYVCIKINIKYMFNLININKQLYPPKSKEKKTNTNKKNERKKRKSKVKFEDILSIYNLLKKIKIEELYSEIEFGNENISFTTFIYIFINAIYGNLANIIEINKIYLSINPNFTKNYITTNIKLHVKPTIKDLIDIAKAIYKIYKNNKDGEVNESNKFNEKSYGNNS